jgi:hypothetical protein
MKCLVSLLILTLAVMPVAAQSSNPADLAAQVQRLAAQMEAQQKQIEQLQRSQNELLEQLRAERAKSTTPTAATAVAAPTNLPAAAAPTNEPAAAVETASAPAQTGTPAPYEHGIALGDKVRLGGYGSVRFEANDVASGNNIPGGSGAGFTFRRFVLTTDAKPASRLRIYSELEFERLLEIESEKAAERGPGTIGFKQTIEGNPGGAIELEQMWGQYNFAENHGLRAGVVLVPVGRFNILHDDDYWDIPRRTLTDRDGPVLPVKSAWRDLGAGFVGSFNVGKSGKLDYQVYGLNGAALDFNLEKVVNSSAGTPGTAEVVTNSEAQLTTGFFDGSKSAEAVSWRVAYSPTLAGEFAFSGYHGKYAPTFLTNHEALTSLAFDHKWKYKNFESEGEFVYSTFGQIQNVIKDFALAVTNDTNSTAASNNGGADTTATVSFELANLARSKYGVWNDFKYHARPKWLKKSFLGKDFEDPQIIPIFRYERVWLNRLTDGITITNSTVTELAQENLQQDRFTFGVSYRPSLQFAMQAAYEHNRKLDGSRLVFPEVDQKSTNGVILGMSFAF